MVKLKVYKVKKGLAKLLIALGGVMLIAGIIIGVQSAAARAVLNWNAIVLILQGILFLTMGYMNFRSDKYFIEWDDYFFKYLLPGQKQIEMIELAKIKGIIVNLFEILLQLTDSETKIDLGNLQFEEIKLLKRKFEDMKTSIENGSHVDEQSI